LRPEIWYRISTNIVIRSSVSDRPWFGVSPPPEHDRPVGQRRLTSACSSIGIMSLPP